MPPKKKHLAAVPPDARARKAEPKSITEAIDGSGRDVLAAMRRALARKLDDGEVASNSIASAYKELRELDRLIRAEDAAVAQEVADDAERDSRTRRSFNASAI